ncbi:hypothetical protein QR680_002869 [Steinernema hermaphroditum]|uniref:Peptidase A2 domain-containing protein n=1 Tax=Steinernema hermaphroditum TaxID=289476 RepID=A0AA39H4D4_9BILA|nr:hypothetical protein QR680_002869 [Steinernema hermaphroditum]
MQQVPEPSPESNAQPQRGPVESLHVNAFTTGMLMTFGIQIEGRDVRALFDSGSQISFCNRSFVQSLNVPVFPTMVAARCVNDSKVVFRQCFDGRVTIGSFDKKFMLFILNNNELSVNVILGRDVLQSLGQITFDFTARNVRVGGSTLPMEEIYARMPPSPPVAKRRLPVEGQPRRNQSSSIASDDD